MNQRTKDLMFSSKEHDWKTPIDLFKELSKEFRFKLDACTDLSNPLGTKFYYCEHNRPNGLTGKWINWTFCNPPFRSVKAWVHKALEENVMRGIGSVLLLPARTDTQWFHGPIWHTERQKPQIYREVRFLKGRLKFGNQTNSAPFPSMLVIFHPPAYKITRNELKSIRNEHPRLMKMFENE